MFFTTNPARMPGKFAAMHHRHLPQITHLSGKTAKFVIATELVFALQGREHLTVTLA